MQILNLKANKDSFHTVPFNKKGLSIILGKREDKANTDVKNTYNSVGKSLIIRIIHFCLGSNAIDEFKNKIPGWIFYLEFEIGGKVYVSERQTSGTQKIKLNGADISLDNFRDTFEKILFDINEPIKYLKYRSLISRFIRPYRASYESYDKYVPKEEDYAKQLCNAYLLGLDPFLASKKHELKQSFDDAQKLAKNIEKDHIFSQFFRGGKDVEIEIVDLAQKISRLEKRISEFIIAEDYGSIKKEADDLSASLREKRNKITILKNAVRNIEKSLNIQPDISKDQLIKFYQDAQVNLGEIVIKRIDEVSDFYTKLISDRRKRLEAERRKFLIEQRQLEEEVRRLGKIEDEKLQRLNSTGALDDYKTLTEELSDLRSKHDKLETYRNIVKQYKIKQSEIEMDFQRENIETLNYLEREKNLIDSNITLFKEFAQSFYENKNAGIQIINNDGRNQIRYNINAKIEDDAGDGVNQVKIFCFDFTILKGQHNHKVNFLFHDSRLLSEMDPRQRATVFKEAYAETQQADFQYIISVNEDLIESIQPYFSSEDYKAIIEDNVVLELTDKNPQSKLLGIQVDMDYEK